jgi:hypothetical protein
VFMGIRVTALTVAFNIAYFISMLYMDIDLE